MMAYSVTMLEDLLQTLQSNGKDFASKQVFVGFDGFIDKIKKAIKQKAGKNTVFFKTLPEFSERINSASGKSGQIEMITQKVKLGGNAPIFANTMGKLKVRTICFGSLGYPKPHSVFTDLNENCEVMSVLNPGESDAIEFDDGKMIFSDLSVFEEYDWAYIKKTADMQRMSDAIRGSHLIAFLDWVNLPHASDIWKGVLEEIIEPSGKRDFLFFFDLCDPTKKTTSQIKQTLKLISKFSQFGKVTLGLNENEALKLWAAIKSAEGVSKDVATPPVREAGAVIYQFMDIDCLLLHPSDRTIAFTKKEVLELKGNPVVNPKVLTGGGDNLNAGYCQGLLHGLPLSQCLLLGMATAGAYIENGYSPGISDIIDHIETWIGNDADSGKAHVTPKTAIA
ncbi:MULTISPECIES: hypothetical protein [unclassified Imperialibacter]|uniref:hypothetical protein n=1 Tax=unclassified Imperialibacter TaxID=2629706 RepID=UPI001258B117|nr:MULTISPECIES: hypothetical protein [unclassified Imperialibacter]CAD5265299.1 conserved hypothetical protein [Imperialibacter sp. 89]CAD5270173.1 conserved hypothetical protein [Imperialibacter sp. 75]VVT09793.1 conserved hypothetical protein [Imperialibacter sp. EC-SDR9]